jgi:hypothetical protein
MSKKVDDKTSETATASFAGTGANPDAAGEIERLANLNLIEYERQREDAGKRLCLRLHVLDQLVQQAREQGEDNPQGLLIDSGRWPEPVNGAVLLNEITAAIRRYVLLEKNAAEATALWVIHTHAIDAFAISPRLAITSAVMRCGKTTLLDVLSGLVRCPMTTVNTTAAGIYRLIAAKAPTLLIDEADTFLMKSKELRGILNSGHRRNSAFVVRADETFSTWAAVAIAMIGRLSSTLEDRSILVRLQRRRADEFIAPFRLDQIGDLRRLARMTARFATDNFDRLKAADPKVPSILENREADNWRPLLAIADVAGGEWLPLARQISEDVTTANRASEQSPEVMLLEDIFAVFVGQSISYLPSSHLVGALAQLEDRPWADWKGGRSITPKAVACLLAPFKIKPFEKRMGNHVLRGYRLAQFEDAFARYVAASRGESATPLQNFRSSGYE